MHFAVILSSAVDIVIKSLPEFLLATQARARLCHIESIYTTSTNWKKVMLHFLRNLISSILALYYLSTNFSQLLSLSSLTLCIFDWFGNFNGIYRPKVNTAFFISQDNPMCRNVGGQNNFFHRQLSKSFIGDWKFQ